VAGACTPNPHSQGSLTDVSGALPAATSLLTITGSALPPISTTRVGTKVKADQSMVSGACPLTTAKLVLRAASVRGKPANQERRHQASPAAAAVQDMWSFLCVPHHASCVHWCTPTRYTLGTNLSTGCGSTCIIGIQQGSHKLA
jgi:hypothetical protein